MKKFIFIIAVLLIACNVSAQWQTSLSWINPRVRNAIQEVRDNIALTARDDIWYVDDDGSDYNGGKSWDKAVATLTKALTLAGDNDVILVAPGDYEELGVLNITEAALKIIGPGIDNQNVAMVYVSDSTNHAMTINAHNVEIAGLGFTVNKDTKDAIRTSTTASKYKIWIHDCRFDGYGQGEYAIHTGTTYDSPDIVVENCVFRSWQTASIYANATRGIYRNNIFHVDASKIGIEHVPTTGSRPDQGYYDNIFLGANSSEVAFKITNSPTAGTWFLTKNMFVNCATDITTGKGDNMAVFNYSSSATGGAISDPSP